MKARAGMNLNQGRGVWMAAAVATALVIGVCFAWWMFVRADRQMRVDLLQRTRLVAQAVNLDRVRALSGTEADLGSLHYRRLKEQLTAVRSADSDCRFVYLMGRKADGAVFFFVDSEPDGSKDCSPPGQVYEEVPAGGRRAFDTGASVVVGPVGDRWGVWISALVPLADPSTGAVLAVLGMDIDARTWNWDVAARAALPVALLFVLLIGSVAVFAAARSVDASPRPFLGSLLLPLAATVMLLAVCAGVLLWQQQRQRLAEEFADDVTMVSRELRADLDNQAAGLAGIARTIAADATVQKLLGEGDAGRLQSAWRPVFETLHRERNLTALSFLDRNRVCLLRVHQPNESGDRIERQTGLDAERTGTTASDIELGPQGTFMLQTVQPVFRYGKLAGYVELGKEIDDVLQAGRDRSDLELAVTVPKQQLNRRSWEEGMRRRGRVADWDRLPRSVVVHASQGRLPAAFTPWIAPVEGGNARVKANREIVLDGKTWRASVTSLENAAGREVGGLLIMRDVSAEKASFARLMTLGGMAGAVLLVLLLGFIYVLLRRADAGIRAQQEALEESGKQLLEVLENSLDASYKRNLQTDVYDYLSPVFARITGHALDALKTSSMDTQLSLVHPDDLAGFRQVIAESMSDSSGKAHHLDYRFRHKDGRYRWLQDQFIVVRDAKGRPSARIGSVRDITVRKRAQEALLEGEALMRAITDSAQDAILMMDADGLISFWNPAAERILGYAREEAMGRNLHQLIAPQRFHDAHGGAFQRFQRTGQGDAIGKTLELEACHKSGHEISVGLSLSALRFREGWHTVGIIRDITDQKRAEADLRSTNLHLEEATARATEMAVRAKMASAAKSEFLANMSHEIRTPMNGVVGMTGLLLDTELDDEQRRYAEVVRASGESLLGLINDILDFSKIEAGRLDLETLDFDLSNLLDDLAATVALWAEEKGLELLCAADPAVPTLLRGDPGRLRQILTNLVGNAVKFTPAGEVGIRVSLVEESERDVLLRFSVRDTGIGIAADKIGLLFEKFSQVDASTTRRYGGTGLGLAISKQLAELMGGGSGVESEEGKGSDFWFTARLGKQAEGARAESLPPADLRGVRALVVDDNATNCEILISRLLSWGMRPSEARDGPVALRALQRALDENDPFRIAVIDMQMPGMDGETLGRTIRADDRLAGIRMVMLTSLGTRGDARRFEEIGFAAYATKPIRHEEFKAVLSLALTGRDGVASMPRPITTRHMVRETLNLFVGRAVRILLAEDNITNQQVALGILKKMSLRADAVANGAEALKALETLPYDLVLMDVQMPEMDGFEATRQIRDPRSAVRNHRIPIIAMTAHAMQGDRERCLQAGMNDYVAKPVSPRALAKALDKWLPRGSADTTDPEPGTPEGAAPPPAREPEALVFDKAGMMSRVMDDEDLAEEIMAMFLEDMPQQIAKLRSCLETGDATGAERRAHSIKGASATVGGECLRAVAFEMEKAGETGDLRAAAGHLAELDAEFDRLRLAMTRERGRCPHAGPDCRG